MKVKLLTSRAILEDRNTIPGDFQKPNRSGYALVLKASGDGFPIRRIRRWQERQSWVPIRSIPIQAGPEFPAWQALFGSPGRAPRRAAAGAVN
jgi:hypothetical protein